jgi:hypothetical protein
MTAYHHQLSIDDQRCLRKTVCVEGQSRLEALHWNSEGDVVPVRAKQKSSMRRMLLDRLLLVRSAGEN